MKKIFSLLMLVLMLTVLMLPILAIAEGETVVVEDETVATVNADVDTVNASVDEPPDIATGDPFTWAYLATIAGATAFTLLVAQFLKFPLDKVWKIPTRVLVYVIALITMIVATAFTGGLTIQTALLAAVNAFIVALSAYGAYEITFAKLKT